jgi:catechol 2,3-dioxygenase-like lactoylglutathione lyase family enzyme
MGDTVCSLNHVSVVADDMDESVAFYRDVFGMDRVPSPDFGFETEWLSMSDGRQLHLFDLDAPASRYNHFGVTVSDFEAVYRAAKRRDVLTDSTDADSPSIYRLQDDAVQMYVEDPAGNLVEVNWPDADALDAEVRDELVDRSEQRPQTGEAREATLGLERID